MTPEQVDRMRRYGELARFTDELVERLNAQLRDYVAAQSLARDVEVRAEVLWPGDRGSAE